jgi:hypothetical protein
MSCHYILVSPLSCSILNLVLLNLLPRYLTDFLIILDSTLLVVRFLISFSPNVTMTPKHIMQTRFPT